MWYKIITQILFFLNRDMIDSIESLHERNFIHGYVEPGNFMIFNDLGRLSARLLLGIAFPF